jgi:hypothetical protein
MHNLNYTITLGYKVEENLLLEVKEKKSKAIPVIGLGGL